jgi:hypothetical protein
MDITSMPWKDKEKNKEYQRRRAKEYRLKYPERVRAIQRRYREKHKEEIKQREREYNRSERGKARDKRYRERHPEKIKALNDKWNKINQGIRFKGKQIPLPENPRIGICTICGKEGNTNLHHTKYDPKDPLAHTVELCIKCHNDQHPRGRNKLGQFTTGYVKVGKFSDDTCIGWAGNDAKDGELVVIEGMNLVRNIKKHLPITFSWV